MKWGTASAQAILMLLLGGCASVEIIPTTTLPAPVIAITHMPLPAAVNTSTPPPTPLAQIPIPKSEIAQLADNLYGARVIQYISIPALGVESQVVAVGWRVHFSGEYQSGEFEWDNPASNVGWVITSSLPDEIGNIILYGHNNTYEKVFEHLADLSEGDVIDLQTGLQHWEYKVRNILLLPILGASAEQIKSYRQYLLPTQDARVTLISCWPPISNTYRVIVIAKPASRK